MLILGTHVDSVRTWLQSEPSYYYRHTKYSLLLHYTHNHPYSILMLQFSGDHLHSLEARCASGVTQSTKAAYDTSYRRTWDSDYVLQ